MSCAVIDLFSGAGGWDVAARELGIDTLGIELDADACATSEAAGFRVMKADVAALDPFNLPCLCDFEPAELHPSLTAHDSEHGVGCPAGASRGLWGLAASPPCVAFSMAGHGHGRRALSAYEEAIERTLEGKPPSRDELDEACEDERGHLVLEPLRWALALEPMWITLEQVEPVLPLWEAMATGLSEVGYSAWCGILSAETFGCPQTRKRAILIARRDGKKAHGPEVTHQRYVPPRRTDEQSDSLFDMPEAERIVLPEDRGLLPWISMAEALGWGEGDSPSPAPTVTGGGGETGGVEVFASKGARGRVLRSTKQPKCAVRSIDEPAPTITAGHSTNDRVWCSERPSPTLTTTRRSKNGMLVGRQMADSEGENIGGWGWERPATTVVGDPRVSKPGHHGSDVSGSQMANAVRVTVKEAAILQTFPRDYPWQGSRSSIYRQIGNAIPGKLALAVLREATS